MRISSAQIRAAKAKAELYGVRYDGLQERGKNKAPFYTWTDLVTGTTLLTPTIKELPDKIRAVRKKFMNPKAKRNSEKALELSRKFYGFDPRKVRKMNIDWPMALVCIGAAAQVDYISDKFDGVTRRYFHEFKKPAVVYVGDRPQKDGTNLIIIKGQFKIKPEGITG